jgi:hypothetical protein
MRPLFFYSLLGLVCVFLLMSCDQDPLRLSYRKVAGTYDLHRWEDGKIYYLEEKGAENKNGGGVLDGVVEQIGWNNDYIIAKRRSTFGGDPNGWMVLDVNKKTIKGPFTDEMIEKIPEAKGMRFLDSAKAWAELR